MRNQSFLLPCGLVGLLVLAAVFGQGQEGTRLTGMWNLDLQTGDVSLRLGCKLERRGSRITAVCTDRDGNRGDLRGTFDGDVLVGEVHLEPHNCLSVLSLRLLAGKSLFSGSFTGTDCLGEVWQGAALLRPRPADEGTPPGQALRVEFGEKEELADVRRVFLYAPPEEGIRERILRELAKGDFEIVSSAEEADTFLVFGTRVEDLFSAILVWQEGGLTYQEGTGYAVRFPHPDVARICWQFRDTRQSLFERHPAVNFGRDFVRLIRRLRAAKPPE